MSKITNIGHLFPIDENGYIGGIDKQRPLSMPWARVVANIKTACLEHFCADLHSVYIRGSVARGTAVEGISDVDNLLVFENRVKVTDTSWIDGFRTAMNRKYRFHTGVSFRFAVLDDLLNLEGYRFFRFLLKTQSVCILGEDLAPRLSRFKPGHDVVYHAFLLKEDMDTHVAGIRLARDSDVMNHHCRKIMKKILRTGMELVMADLGVYARDLYPCYMAFKRRYQEQHKAMRQALEYAVNPPQDKHRILAFLDDFGAWMVAEAADKFNRQLPTSFDLQR